MKHLGLAVLMTSVVVVFAGCGGVGSEMPQGTTTNVGAKSARISKDAYSGDLLYVAPGDFRNTTRKHTRYSEGVAYYTYPGGELVGTLNAGGIGLCSDASGNVFVVNSGSIIEFAHGGNTPINTLGNSSYVYEHCSVDSTTGNLAVTYDGGGRAGVAIFKNAKGGQTTYAGSDFQDMFYCGYDSSGNLFADGQIGGTPAFAELPAGGSKLETIVQDLGLNKAGQVQWDGTYMTIADEDARKLYRLKIYASGVTIVGTTNLKGSGGGIRGTWIYGNTVIAPIVRNGKKLGAKNIGYWNYPQGGSPTKTIEGTNYFGLNAVAISPGNLLR